MHCSFPLLCSQLTSIVRTLLCRPPGVLLYTYLFSVLSSHRSQFASNTIIVWFFLFDSGFRVAFIVSVTVTQGAVSTI